ncbi:MAG: hypothetical protein F2664_06775 [Actinobacteria bacterium]|jgi:hypothetical protein|uniref:Unannotated protein n=1 Tax=freshwater metagenome TaxID=449393 RepID=A0A6J7VGJ0_9ZZZZ|nr:hypothetical protein [Actinomycetota bacterium]MSY88298.1 hypothetical protein [Actinomycetota bacterium]MTA51235.1 hypothetical protein [Actinomycetota bacterium]
MSAGETILLFGVLPVGIFLLIAAISWASTGEKGRGVAGLERPDWEI